MKRLLSLFPLSAILGCILILLVSCNNESPDKQTLNFEGFSSTTNLKGQEIRIPISILKPERMLIVDTFLIVSQNISDSIFTFFKLPDLEFLTSFGTKGRGPDEFTGNWFSTSLKPVSSDKSVFAVGNQNTNVNYYNIQEILDGIYSPYFVAKLPPEIQAFQALVCFSDTMLIGMPFGGLGGITYLFKYRNESKYLEQFSGYPIDFPNLSNDDRSNLFACQLTVKGDNSKFAQIFNDIGEIKIYNPTSNNPFTIIYSNYPDLFKNKVGLTNESKRSTRGTHIFSWEATSTNRYIYAKIFACEYDKISDGREILRSYIHEIDVFDWDGNPITRLKPDRFYSTFAVDPDDRYLYTIHPDSANIIMKYELRLPK